MHFESQCGEDRWLVETRKIWREGTFIEVGAFDGVRSSNTFYLERVLGWRGLCIEADPFIGVQCIVNRKSPTIIAACGRRGFQEFAVNSADHGLSGFGRPGSPFTVPSFTLSELISFSKIKKVDLLSIDTEGTELEVWQSGEIAWEEIGSPTFVIMEHQTCQEPSNLEPILEVMVKQWGYKEAFRTQYNCIFERA